MLSRTPALRALFSRSTLRRSFASAPPPSPPTEPLSDLEYHRQSEDLLVALHEAMEDLLDDVGAKDADATYSTGVLTLQLAPHGTYVLNKQGASRQIWYSSPLTGPKRFDFSKTTWHDARNPSSTLLDTLARELRQIYPAADDLRVYMKKNSENI